MSHILTIPQFCLRKQLLGLPLVYLLGLLLRATVVVDLWTRPSVETIALILRKPSKPSLREGLMFQSKLRVRLPGHLSVVSRAHCGRNHVSFMTEKLKPVIVSLRVCSEYLQFPLQLIGNRVFTQINEKKACAWLENGEVIRRK